MYLSWSLLMAELLLIADDDCCVLRPIDAKLFISDMEFFISLRSRFSACAFISDVMWYCDDVACDVNVLDVVLLLFTTWNL